MKMYKTKLSLLLNVLSITVLLLLVEVKGGKSRSFINPLNNKALDLFIAVDESNSYMNPMELGLMKTALNNMAMELNPSGSNPYFGIYFFGATSSVTLTVPFKTASANQVKSFLDRKQYTRAEAKPSTLVSAFSSITSDCSTQCRANIPRTTVVISSSLDSSAENSIRQLENNFGMTVIVVGIGSSIDRNLLNEMASHPAYIYAMSVMTFYELILSVSHLASVISDVPRPLDINAPISIFQVTNGVYYTMQVNTYPYTALGDTMIMFASNCQSCPVFGSLSEPNPSSVNTVANTNRHNFYACDGYPNNLSYFRIPKGTRRLYITLLGNGMTKVKFLINVFSLPSVMEVGNSFPK